MNLVPALPTEASEGSIPEAFERQVARAPDAVAATFAGDVLSFRQLDRRANALAFRLVEAGLRPGGAVGIALDPGLDVPVAVLAVLKAGGCYVPVSTLDPVGRIAFQLTDTAARFLVTQERYRRRFVGLRAALVTVDAEEAPAGVDDGPLADFDPQRTAYVLYTSGSSGRPKGVAVSHRSLGYYLDWHRRHLYAEADALDLPMSASLSFAAAVTQLYTPLLGGRPLHILPRDLVRDPPGLFAWYAAHPDYGLYCVPTLWSELVRHAESGVAGLTPPRGVFLSGEPAGDALVARSFAAFPRTRLWNLYGPTEATANASYTELRAGRPVTIGTAIAGSDLHLVDDQLRPVPDGAEGEICIAGPGVASGYINLPDATLTRFVADPFARDGGRRMFRTGDIARRRPDGDLVYVGRRDFQVKVRGHRVECGEIEIALQEHPAIRQAVVVGLRQDGATRSLAAYVAFRFARYASVDELRHYLADRLPDYMIPAAFVVLEDFPKLANGKVDRSRLPPPGRARPSLAYPSVPPGDQREKAIVRCWEEALGIEGVGVDDDFFDLGGDSLRAAALIARLGQVGLRAIGLADLFAHPTPARLARVAAGATAAGVPVPAEQRPSPESDGSGCTPGQRGLWLLEQTFPEQTAYNMQFSLHVDGEIDEAILRETLQALVADHEALRSTFAAPDGVPSVAIDPPGPLAFAAHDLASLDADRAMAEAERMAREARLRRFALGDGPLIRFDWVRLPDRHGRLVVTVHHLVFDGRSINVFSEDLVDRLRRRLDGKSGASRQAGQYSDWAGRQRAGATREADLAFWRGALDGLAALELPTDMPRPPVRSFAGEMRALRLPAASAASLAALCRGRHLTPFQVLLAAFLQLLRRYTGQDDLAVAVPVANRPDAADAGIIGFCANTLVLRSRVAVEGSFAEWATAVRDRTLEALAHQSLPFDELVEALRLPRQLDRAPLAAVMFALHETPAAATVADGLAVRVREDGNGGSKCDLTLDVHQDRDGLELRLTYRTDLFHAATIDRLLERYVHLVGRAVGAPDEPLSSLDLVTDADAEGLATWNATDRVNERDLGLAALVLRQAAATPSAVALMEDGSPTSYAELEERSRSHAARLRAAGVQAGDRVGLHLAASAEMLAAMLGILRAGAAYVPLDPAYPRARLDFTIEDAGLAAVITAPDLVQRLEGVACRVLLVGGDEPAAEPFVDAPADPDGLMYLMYTSGSTGRPKGVRVHNAGPANYVLWMRDRFPLGTDDAVLLRTSINFDISVWEIFLPLICGARLVIGRPAELQGPEALAALIVRERITNVQFVPSALRGFVAAGALADCRSLRRIFAGGEILPPSLVAEVQKSFAGEVHNLYGPTEASVYVCHWQCGPADAHRPVPIGRPIDNARIHILDDEGREVPVGLTGEIYIGGVCVAAGYHNRPEQTERAFPPDRFDGRPGARLFRTGDLGRYSADGAIEFLGRKDRQVKVRGYRIELGEIEHHVSSHPQVKHAVVIVREDEEADVRLVAYLVYREAGGPAAEDLRSYLRERLPDYMVPAHFVALDSIPLLPNDKADLAALPRPEFRKAADAELGRLYASDRERDLASIWEDALGSSRFGPEDSFFDVGGHSLLVARVAAMIEQRLGIAVTTLDLFQYPTIRSLARHLAGGDDPARRVVVDMARRAALGRNRRPPIVPLKKRAEA